MQPMTTFDPDRPCRVHDQLNDRTFDWHTGWAANYRQYARLGGDELVYFDGLIIDGWVPKGVPS